MQAFARGERPRAESSGRRTTSWIHAGSPVAQTRPGRPTPRAKVVARLMASNSGKRVAGAFQMCDAAQRVDRVIDHPERAVLPAEALADRGEDFGRGLVEG